MNPDSNNRVCFILVSFYDDLYIIGCPDSLKKQIMKTLKNIAIYILGFISLIFIFAEIDCGIIVFFAIKLIAFGGLYWSIFKLTKNLEPLEDDNE